MSDQENDPTKRHLGPFDDGDATRKQEAAPSDSTALFPTESDNPVPVADENALDPSRLRYVLVCLLLALMAAWIALNAFNILSQKSTLGVSAAWTLGTHYVNWVDPKLPVDIQVGDAVLSIDGQQLNARYRVRQMVREFGPNEAHTYEIQRSGESFERIVMTEPVSFERWIGSIALSVVIPAVFFIVGFIVFLFKPNNRLTVLTVISFSLIAASSSPLHFISYAEAAFPVVLLWQIGYFLSLLGNAVLLHFFLFFPKPSRIVRRFPKAVFYIYTPFLLYVLPTEIAQQVSWNGFPAFDIFYNWQILFLGDYFYTPYLVAGLIVLLLNFREADELGKRRMRVLMASIPLALLPIIFFDFIAPPIENLLEIQFFSTALWRELATGLPIVVAPPIFAYAVVKHRVIPISFIIRRGIQYLFAKNGLRLLVLIPAIGIAWNIMADPDRTLSDLIFQNSASFYVYALLAAIFALLSRYRLNEWIDRRFFRQQIDQESFFRGLTDNVKASDSIQTLSRLVSNQIQEAFHPKSLHFFFEDPNDNNFSSGFSSDDRSKNLRLPAESPILLFMNEIDGATEFPSATANLPAYETTWLERLDTRLLVPMQGTQGKLAGFISLGEKESETTYSSREKELLESLANQIALVHENISLKTRMRQEQEIKNQILSRFDEGNINLLKECRSCGRCYDRSAEFCADCNSELIFTLPVERTIEKRYRLEHLLGKGGMGAVYAATDLRINRTVALKILSGSLFGNHDAQARFEREARTAGKLNHRNIVTVFDYGTLSTEGAFLVMELVEGETLAKVLRREHLLEKSVVIKWLGQVFDGLIAAHEAGIIHRDLKPDNILVTTLADGTVRLCILDFGLARIREGESSKTVTVTGAVIGTLGYMSPEQLNGEKVDERSDLYSMAVIIYECLFGSRPFVGRTYMELLQAVSSPVEIDRNDPFFDFLSRGLAFRRDDRFQSAVEMKRPLIEIGES